MWRKRWVVLLSTLCLVGGGSLLWLRSIQDTQSEREFANLLADAKKKALAESASDFEVAQRAEHIPTFWGKLQDPQPGDWPQIRERHVLRVLVPYGRTFFYHDSGRTRGISADLLAELERYINQKLKTGRTPISVLAIPVERDQLISGVANGLGDIAVGNLTVTPQRQQLVDFITLEGFPQREIVISSSTAPEIMDERDLSNQALAVRHSSSYFSSIEQLNRRLVQAGRPRAEAFLVPEALEDEDLLEMLDASLIDFAIIDEWKAKLWQPVYPNIQLHSHVVLRQNAQVGWAIRKQSPELAKILQGFKLDVKKKHLLELKFAEYQQRIARLGSVADVAEWRKVEQVHTLFQRFAADYQFDHLLLLAQGYQESRLDQQLTSKAGAVGVMQLMPATGKAMQVGDIRQLEPNIHAGVKYLRQLHDNYFSEPSVDEINQALFSFAAYNAGPTAINKMRSLARKQGRDANRWFGQVEVEVGKELGLETVRYVRNIVKYYVAYRQLFVKQQTRAAAKTSLSNQAYPAR